MADPLRDRERLADRAKVIAVALVVGAIVGAMWFLLWDGSL